MRFTQNAPIGITADSVNNCLYWIEWNVDSRIWRADLDGSNAQRILYLAGTALQIVAIPESNTYCLLVVAATGLVCARRSH